MLKKHHFLFLLIFFLIVLPLASFVLGHVQSTRSQTAAGTALFFSPSQISATIGEEFSITLIADTGQLSIVQAQVELQYDPTRLKVIEVVNSPRFPNVTSQEEITSDGKIKMTVATASVTQGFVGITSLAAVRFQALAATTSPISIRYTPETFVGSASRSTFNSLVSTSAASMTILPTIAATPIITTSPGSTPPTTLTNLIYPKELSTTNSQIRLVEVKAREGNRVYLKADIDPSVSAYKVDWYINGKWTIQDKEAPFYLGGDTSGVPNGFMVTSGVTEIRAVVYYFWWLYIDAFTTYVIQ